MSPITLPGLLSQYGLPASTQQQLIASSLRLVEFWELDEKDLLADFPTLQPEECLLLALARRHPGWTARSFPFDPSTFLSAVFPASATEPPKLPLALSGIDWTRLSDASVQTLFSPHMLVAVQHIRFAAHLERPFDRPPVEPLRFKSEADYTDGIVSAIAWLLPLALTGRQSRKPLGLKALGIIAHIVLTHQSILDLPFRPTAEYAAQQGDALSNHILALDSIMSVQNEGSTERAIAYWKKALNAGLLMAIPYLAERIEDLGEKMQVLQIGFRWEVPDVINHIVARIFASLKGKENLSLKTVQEEHASTGLGSSIFSVFPVASPKERRVVLSALQKAASVSRNTESLILLAQWPHVHPDFVQAHARTNTEQGAVKPRSEGVLSFQDSLSYWNELAKRGFVEAHAWLGHMHEHGLGMQLPQIHAAYSHYAKVHSAITKANDTINQIPPIDIDSCIDTMTRLADMAEFGNGILRNVDDAIKYSEMAISLILKHKTQNEKCDSLGAVDRLVYFANLLRLVILGQNADISNKELTKGTNIYQNAIKAIELFPDSKYAAYMCALCHLNGTGTQKDIVRAVPLLHQAGVPQNPSDIVVSEAAYLLALLYDEGLSVRQDADEAYKMLMIGSCLNHPLPGILPDVKVSLALAAYMETGRSALALSNYSHRTEILETLCKLSTKDFLNAASIPSLDHLAQALYHLGLLYSHQSESSTENIEKGFTLLRRAVDLGHASAANQMGINYEKASSNPKWQGVYKSHGSYSQLGIAARFYALAAKRGCLEAVSNLSTLTLSNHADAIACLGLCHLHGWGLTSSVSSAAEHIELSKILGSKLGLWIGHKYATCFASNVTASETKGGTPAVVQADAFTDQTLQLLYALRKEGFQEAGYYLAYAHLYGLGTPLSLGDANAYSELVVQLPTCFLFDENEGAALLLKARCLLAKKWSDLQRLHEGDELHVEFSDVEAILKVGAVKNKNVDCMHELGMLYLVLAESLPKTSIRKASYFADAITWTKNAAQYDHPCAVERLARLYERGYDESGPMMEHALKWWMRGAELKLKPSLEWLARHYYTQAKYKEAFGILKQVNESDARAASLYWGARILETGAGIGRRDIEKARDWFERATKLKGADKPGIVDVLQYPSFPISHLARQSQPYLTKQPVQIFPWQDTNNTQKPCEPYQIEAHFSLGQLYSMAHGDPRFFNQELAVKHIRIAMDKGHIGAHRLWVKTIRKGLFVQPDGETPLDLHAVLRQALSTEGVVVDPFLRSLYTAEIESTLPPQTDEIQPRKNGKVSRLSPDQISVVERISSSQSKTTNQRSNQEKWENAVRLLATDVHESQILLRELVNQDYGPAYVVYGMLLLEHFAQDTKISADIRTGIQSEAAHALAQAAKSGHAAAENLLGHCFEHGIGAVRNLSEAYQWYLRSAQHGDENGAFNAARLLLAGVGVERNRPAAVLWLWVAAHGGCAAAQYNLGVCLMNGLSPQSGLLSNPPGDKKPAADDALLWIRRAAWNGHVPAQHTLAAAFRNGRGVARDVAQSRAWLRSAAQNASSASPQGRVYAPPLLSQRFLAGV